MKREATSLALLASALMAEVPNTEAISSRNYSNPIYMPTRSQRVKNKVNRKRYK